VAPPEQTGVSAATSPNIRLIAGCIGVAVMAAIVSSTAHHGGSAE
jgi:hypothetical protein